MLSTMRKTRRSTTGRFSVASTRSIARPRFRRRSAGGSVARTRKPPIDINAWQAGIAQRPEDYEWCSFAAAVKGSEKARRGYAFMYGSAEDWDVIRDSHEKSMRNFHDACLLMAIGEAWKYGVLPAATRSGPCASRWLSLRLSLRR